MKNRQLIFDGLLGIFLALLSGVAFILAFQPYEIWPLIFIGWVPVLVALGARCVCHPAFFDEFMCSFKKRWIFGVQFFYAVTLTPSGLSPNISLHPAFVAKIVG